MQDFVKQKKNIHKKLKIAALRSAQRQSQKIQFKTCQAVLFARIMARFFFTLM